MTRQEQYERQKSKLLSEASICKANRLLFKRFFEYEEYKLKRQNQLATLDEACYKTLLGYMSRFRNANKWFENKPWRELTRKDIKRVYDDLEDGKIKNRAGLPFVDRAGYYNKIFKSKPFRLAGKAELAKEVIEFPTGYQDRVVRFVTEETFRQLVSVVSKPSHLLLFWLAWDIGENIMTLLALTAEDFIRQRNPYSGEVEYLVNLPREKIKRSRRTRSEPTLYPETVQYADIVLAGLSPNELVFPFGHRQALKVMRSAVTNSNARCMPRNDAPSWKDLRSGMACHLLRSGWTSDEVNARLGHTPGSKALGAYINYLAIDRQRPKKKLHDTSLEEMQSALEASNRGQKLLGERLTRQVDEGERLRAALDEDLRRLRAAHADAGLGVRHRRS